MWTYRAEGVGRRHIECQATVLMLCEHNVETCLREGGGYISV